MAMESEGKRLVKKYFFAFLCIPHIMHVYSEASPTVVDDLILK